MTYPKERKDLFDLVVSEGNYQSLEISEAEQWSPAVSRPVLLLIERSQGVHRLPLNPMPRSSTYLLLSNWGSSKKHQVPFEATWCG